MFTAVVYVIEIYEKDILLLVTVNWAMAYLDRIRND